MKHKGNVRNILIDTVNKQKWLSSGILITVLGAIGASLISPLLLGKIVDSITAGHAVAFSFFVLYFVVLALTGFMDTAHWQEHCAIKSRYWCLMIRFLHWINRRRKKCLPMYGR